MKYIITKGRGTTPLNGTFINDLPTTGKCKWNEKTRSFESVYTDKKIFEFNNDCYSVFDTEDDALRHITYIKKSIEEERERYEDCIKGSTDKLLKVANNLKVVEVR